MMRPSPSRPNSNFGVGDDDALLAADLLAEIIDRARHALERLRDVVAQNLAHARDRDVLVMAGLGLGRRAEDRRLQFCAFDQTCRQLLARQRALRGILLPCRAGEITADHTFDGKHRSAPAQHRPTGDLGAMFPQRRDFLNDFVGVGADHVMRHHAFEPPKPPRADLRQHRALHWDGFRHHHVERADAVGGQQQHAIIADRIDIAHLAAPDPWQRAGRWRASRSCGSCFQEGAPAS